MQTELDELKRQMFKKNLRHIFTEWQTSIIDKKLKNAPLTEAERVEFSRIVRKKIVAMDVLKELRLLLY